MSAILAFVLALTAPSPLAGPQCRPDAWLRCDVWVDLTADGHEIRTTECEITSIME